MTAAASERTSQQGPIATVRLTRSVAVRTLAVSIVAFFGSAYAFGWLRAVIRGQSFEPIVVPAAAPSAVLRWFAVSLAIVGLVVVLHELLHGVCLARFGGSAAFGFRLSNVLLPDAYAASGSSYTRNQLLVALLAPAIGITAVGLVAITFVPSPLLVVALAANAAGSVGDLRLAAVLLGHPRDVRVAGLPHDDQGIAIYGTPRSTVDHQFGARALSNVVTGSVWTLVLTAFGLLAIVFYALVVGTGDVLLAGDRWFLFRHELAGDGSAHLELGVRLLLGVAIVGGIARAVAGFWWRVLA